MRFHMGVSFRLSSLKKFIFPILFGVLAYFLSSYINLGQVYALENELSSSEIISEDYSFEDDDFYNSYLSSYSYEKNVPFSSKVYWFGSHDTTDEILENIYILLFLSFSGLFLLKSITIIKNTRW